MGWAIALNGEASAAGLDMREDYIGFTRYVNPALKDHVPHEADDAFQRGPGTEFAYNNADYLVLGRVIERLTGQSYEAALEARILRPLGLADTGMLHWDRVLPRLAPTYFWRDDQGRLIADMPIYWENLDAAGGMYSTAADLARFAEALYGGRLVRPELLARLLRPGLDDYGYGLWSYSVTRGGRAWRVASARAASWGRRRCCIGCATRASPSSCSPTPTADLDVFAQRIADRLITP